MSALLRYDASAPLVAAGASLMASVAAMKQRTHLDETSLAYERGDLITASCVGRTNRTQHRVWASFARRRPQRSPDHQRSYERRHRLAYSGPMPKHLAARFTVGEMACFRIVADEVSRKNYCDLCLKQIAARAGVCLKTAQRAMWRAKSELLISITERPQPGRKHLPNIVRIISHEWLSWITRGTIKPRKTAGHLCPTTVITDHQQRKKWQPRDKTGPLRPPNPSDVVVAFKSGPPIARGGP